MISYSIDLSALDYVTLCVVITCTIIYCLSTSSHGTWRELYVPHVRPVPLFGNTFRLFAGLEHQMDTYDGIYRRFANEKVCGFYQMKTPYLMIRDPELINRIMVRDFSHFTDHGIQHTEPATNVMANSLFFLSGNRWKTMRQKLNPGFTPGKLRGMHDRINECCEQLTDRIDDRLKQTDRIEAKEIFGKYSTETIGTCAFGLKLDAIKNDNSEFRVHAKKMFQQSAGVKHLLVRTLLAVCPKSVNVLKLQLYPPDSSKFFYSVFNDVITHRNENNVVGNDLMQTLMQARKELVLDDALAVGNKFTESDIIANAILMFTSGSGTVTSTLAFCFYELALNKRVQDKLRREIYAAKEKHGGQLNNDFFKDLHYANMVLDETARMYSVVCVLIREATKTYNVPDVSLVIEKGQKILIPMYNVHHDPKYYPNPEIFDPERFSTEQKSKRMNGTFIPFGDGPRMCIGKRFAELEMILVLSKVLSKFEVLPCDKTEIPLDIRSRSGFVSPKNGVWLSFKPIVTSAGSTILDGRSTRTE